MHGGATAIFGVLAQSLTERHSTSNPLLYLPGLLIAILAHSDFNNSAGDPLIALGVALILLPLALFLAFAKSEHAIHKWLLTDFESHEHLLQAIQSGEYEHSEAGRFILDLKGKFGDAVVAAVFAYMRLHSELVLRFDKLELAREKEEKTPFIPGEWEKSFTELHGLEGKIGKAAMLAVWPHLHFSRKELWELYEIEHQARNHHASS
jgi:hypothetical protein